MEHEGDSDNNCNWCTWYSHQRTGTGNGRFGNKSMSGDHSNYDIVKVSQNTEKSPGNMLSLKFQSKTIS